MRILVIRFGFLGDTLVSIPALHVLKKNHPHAYLGYLSDAYDQKTYVTPRDVLASQGLVDEFFQLTYFPWRKKIWQKILHFFLILKLRSYQWDQVIILESGLPPMTQKHLENLHKLARRIAPRGQVIGRLQKLDFQYFPNGQLQPFPHEILVAMEVLKDPKLNLQIPSQLDQIFLLKPSEYWQEKAAHYLQDKGGPWVAVTPGSNMKSKCWPIENYIQVLKKLCAEFPVIPLIFGSKSEGPLIHQLLQHLPRGHAIIGEPINFCAHILRKCSFYLGNDTGTMHLAAASGIPCVAIFSARNSPGNWEPYGHGHKVFRHYTPCEGCLLFDCHQENLACLKGIKADTVYASCRDLALSIT